MGLDESRAPCCVVWAHCHAPLRKPSSRAHAVRPYAAPARRSPLGAPGRHSSFVVLLHCPPCHERPAALDAGLVRAHGAGRHPHAERRAHLARGQPRSSPSRRRRRPHPRAGPRPGHRRAASARPRAGCRRPVGDDVPAPDGAPSHRSHQAADAGRSRCRWRLRPEPRPGSVRCARLRCRCHRARRRRADVPRRAASDGARREPGRDSRCVVARGGRPCHPQPGPAGQSSPAGRACAAEAQCPRAGRIHPPRPAGGRHRDVTRLHVRLQLLLDHRDARPQLPHLRLRADPRGYRRRESARRARDLPRRRQHHARRREVPGAVPGDRGCRI